MLLRAAAAAPPAHHRRSAGGGAATVSLKKRDVRAHWRLPTNPLSFFGAGGDGDEVRAAERERERADDAARAKQRQLDDAATVQNALRHHRQERELRKRRDRLHQHGPRAPTASPSDGDPAAAEAWGPQRQRGDEGGAASSSSGEFSAWGDDDEDDDDGGEGDGAPLDFYGILGVSPFAETREIRKAYLSAVRSCHPDLAAAAAAAAGSNSSSDGGENSNTNSNTNDAAERQAAATHLSALLNEIYSTLADPSARAHYDALAGFGAFGGGGLNGAPVAASNPFSRAVSGAPPVAGDVPGAVAQALAGAVDAGESALTAHDHVIVDEIACVGCGKCVRVCPGVFELEASRYARARVIENKQPLLALAAEVASQGQGAACSFSAMELGSPFFGGEGGGGQSAESVVYPSSAWPAASSSDSSASASGGGGGQAGGGGGGDPNDACQRLVRAADAIGMAQLTCPVDCIHLVTAAQHALLSEQIARLPRVDAFLMLRSSSRPTADVFVESERLWRRRRAAAETARRAAKEGWAAAAAAAAAGGNSSGSSSSSSSSGPSSNPFAEWFAGAAQHVDFDPKSDGYRAPGGGSGGGGNGNGGNGGGGDSGSVRPKDAHKLASLAASAARAAADWRQRERSARRGSRRVAGALSDGGAGATVGEGGPPSSR